MRRKNQLGGGLARVMLALAVMASFNVIAIQLFMTGNVGPLQNVMPYQAAMLFTCLFVIIVDLMVVYVMMTMNVGSGTARSSFDRLFRKHYNGKNFDEAFNLAAEEWKKTRV